MGDSKNIFISGKITGDPNYREKFISKKTELQQIYPQDIILSPTDIDMSNCNWLEAMGVTESIIDACDLIYFMSDWQESRGACEEHAHAAAMGIQIVEEGVDDDK